VTTPTLRVCTRCGDTYPARTGRCQCAYPNPTPKTISRARRHTIYDSRRWRRIRKHILTRDCHTCTLCGNTEDLVVDHIGGIDYQDPYNPHKLRTLCRTCSGRVDGARGGGPRNG
jgi:5-methylcytosine-specific restriction endonuclease McrA